MNKAVFSQLLGSDAVAIQEKVSAFVACADQSYADYLSRRAPDLLPHLGTVREALMVHEQWSNLDPDEHLETAVAWSVMDAFEDLALRRVKDEYSLDFLAFYYPKVAEVVNGLIHAKQRLVLDRVGEAVHMTFDVRLEVGKWEDAGYIYRWISKVESEVDEKMSGHLPAEFPLKSMMPGRVYSYASGTQAHRHSVSYVLSGHRIRVTYTCDRCKENNNFFVDFHVSEFANEQVACKQPKLSDLLNFAVHLVLLREQDFRAFSRLDAFVVIRTPSIEQQKLDKWPRFLMNLKDAIGQLEVLKESYLDLSDNQQELIYDWGPFCGSIDVIPNEYTRLVSALVKLSDVEVGLQPIIDSDDEWTEDGWYTGNTGQQKDFPDKNGDPVMVWFADVIYLKRNSDHPERLAKLEDFLIDQTLYSNRRDLEIVAASVDEEGRLIVDPVLAETFEDDVVLLLVEEFLRFAEDDWGRNPIVDVVL